MQTAATLLSTLLAAGVLGTVPATLTDRGPALEEFVLEAGQHSIVDLIDRSADFLGRNYLYSEADIANAPDHEIKLQHKMVLDAQGCEEVVSQLAYSRGFAMIQIDPGRGIYEWVYSHGPRRAELSARAPYLAPAEVLRRRQLQQVVATTVPLQHINPNAAQNQLRPFYLSGGPVAASAITIGASGDSILLKGFADQVANAIELLKQIDTAPTTEQIDRSWREQVEARLDALEKKVDDR